MAPFTYINYPAPKKADDTSYTWQEDKNPALRGLPLVAASVAISNLSYLSKFLWNNAGMNKIKDINGIANEVATYKPLVIPTASSEAVRTADAAQILPFGKNLTEPQHTAHESRFYSSADYHALYKSGAVTPLEVVEALLPLVQRDFSARSLSNASSDQDRPRYELAFTTTHVEELREAARASAARWAAGQPLGLLDGVPVTIKCDIDVAGYVSTFGMNPRSGDDEFGKRFPSLQTPAKETAWPAKKLLEAGALMLAQNAMHEIGMDTTGCNPFVGSPINWYNPSYYPGGSSSGGCSGLGAGLVPIALGTDSGGSVRIPPSFNGVYGLKPTHDRLMVIDSSMCVVGPMAATVADLTVAYRTASQRDPEDAVQGQFSLSLPPSWAASSTTTASSPKVLGVPRAWVNRSDPIVVEHFERMVDYFGSKLGFQVVDIELPFLHEAQAVHGMTCLAEGLGAARGRAEPNQDNWKEPLNWQNRLLLSTMQHATFVDVLKGNQVRTVIMRHLTHLYDKYPGLIIVTPMTSTAGWKKNPGDERYGLCDPNMTLMTMRYAWLANSTGCPAVSCPMGYADPEQGEGRVPMGIQAIGSWGAEEQLLAWAALSEKYLHEVYPGGRVRPSKWVDVLSLAREFGRVPSTPGSNDPKKPKTDK